MADSKPLYSCPKCMHVFRVSDLHLPPLAPTATRDILETNDPPLEPQIPTLREFLSKGRARMAALDAQIGLLQSSLEQLLQEKNELDVEISKHEGGLSLIRRIPTEILSHIFAFTMPPHQPNAASAPWTVSAVCTRWRAIIISQPSFWTSIHYKDIYPTSSTSLAKFETQLRRSGRSPLNVEFVVDNWTDLNSEQEEILQLFCKHGGRWESLLLNGPDGLCGPLRRSMKGQLTHLWKLTIDIPYDDGMDMFYDAPQLRTVSANRGFWSVPLPMELPWSQLVQYGGSNTWDGHLHALASASNLVHCSLQITVSTHIPHTTIVLPCLRRLSLSDSEFLGCLETPALQELYCDVDQDTQNPPLLSFLHRQTFKLRKLSLWEFSDPADPADLTPIVEAVPTITHLVLLFTPPIQFLRDFSSRPTIAPAVEHISTFLDTAPDADELHDRFMQAIESRLGGRLKSVKIYTTSMDPPTIWSRLNSFRTRGVECVLFNHPRYRLLENIEHDDMPPELLISRSDD